MTNRHVHPIRGIDRTGHSKSCGQRLGVFGKSDSPLVTWSPRPAMGDGFVLRCLVLDSTPPRVYPGVHPGIPSTDHARGSCVAERVDVYNPTLW